MSQNSFDQRADEVRGQRAYKEFFREQHMVRNISHIYTHMRNSPQWRMILTLLAWVVVREWGRLSGNPDHPLDLLPTSQVGPFWICCILVILKPKPCSGHFHQRGNPVQVSTSWRDTKAQDPRGSLFPPRAKPILYLSLIDILSLQVRLLPPVQWLPSWQRQISLLLHQLLHLLLVLLWVWGGDRCLHLRLPLSCAHDCIPPKTSC